MLCLINEIFFTMLLTLLRLQLLNEGPNLGPNGMELFHKGLSFMLKLTFYFEKHDL